MIAPLLTLQTWLSPALPIGSYVYSHGLEQGIADERIQTDPELADWIDALLARGSGWNDAVLLVAAWHAANRFEALTNVERHARALVVGAERLEETCAQGEAFLAATDPCLRGTIGGPGSGSAKSPASSIGYQSLCLPVAVGYRTATLPAVSTVGLEAVCALYLQAFASNLVWIAARLIPLDQRAALRTIDTLRPVVVETAARAMTATLDDLGSCTWLADLAALEHERLPTRICRT